MFVSKLLKSVVLSMVLALIIVGPAFSANGMVELRGDISEQSRAELQKGRLVDIDTVVQRERELIESGFYKRIGHLRADARLEARDLEPAEKILWTEFFKMTFGVNYPEAYFEKVLLQINELPFAVDESVEFRRALKEEYFQDEAEKFLLSREAHQALRSIVDDPTVRKDSLIWKEAFKLLELSEQYQIKLEKYESARQSRLEQLENWANSLRDDINASAEKQKAAEPAEQAETVIEAIIYGEKPLAMVGGKIVYEGDKIEGLTVAEIRTESIEFSSDGASIVKKVGQQI